MENIGKSGMSFVFRYALAIQLLIVFAFTYSMFDEVERINSLYFIIIGSFINSLALAACWMKLIPTASGDVIKEARCFDEKRNVSQLFFGGMVKDLKVDIIKSGDNSLPMKIYDNYCLAEYFCIGVMSLVFLLMLLLEPESMSSGSRGAPLRTAIGMAIFTTLFSYVSILCLATFFLGLFSRMFKRQLIQK